MGTSILVLLIVAAIAGGAQTLQGHFVGHMDKSMGTLESVFVTYLGGGVLIALIMLMMGGGKLAGWSEAPRYSLFAGVLGLFLVAAVSFSVARFGLVKTSLVMVAAQFASAALIDHFGLFGAELRPLDLSRLGGIGVMFLGAWWVIR